ncbi:MAG TPA: glycosyltransferase, partial [Candidatus Xenobia bacterium]
PFTDAEKYFLRKEELTGVVQHVPTPSDERLARLYKDALALVYPSLYEGFGLPILEAFESGCPVVCSRSSSFVEIAGEAAIYFEPKDPASLVRALRQMQSPDVREQHVLLGRKRADSFSPARTAEETARLYRTIREDSGNMASYP